MRRELGKNFCISLTNISLRRLLLLKKKKKKIAEKVIKTIDNYTRIIFVE